MGESDTDIVIRRILIALDASTQSLAALESVGAMAALLEAELLGLFVEDVNLLRLAGLPFAREVRSASAHERPLSSAQMEQEMRALATKAQQAMAEVGGRMQLRWSFRVVRGQVDAELLAAAHEADMVTVGRARHDLLSARSRLGATAREVAARAPRSVLLLRDGIPTSVVIVVYDDPATGNRLLELASRVIAAQAGRLTVALTADRPERAQRLEEAARLWLQAHGVDARFHHLIDPRPAQLARAVKMTGCGLLMVAGGSPLLRRGEMQEWLEALDCAVLLVR